MNPHISTEEARKQKLPGYDTYKNTHLHYIDDFHRDFGVVSLNLEAIKAFSDTITIAQRHALAAEHAAIKEWFDRDGMGTGSPFPSRRAIHAFMEYVNYEHLKIAAAFELHLKARLLSRDYILHEIDKGTAGYETLAAKQNYQPIRKQDVFAIKSYHHDGTQNYLPGLRDASLKFSLIVKKPAYRVALDLTDQQLNIIDDYRQLRNQVHFPGDILESPNIQAFPKPIDEFLIGFINDELVVWSNALILKHDMPIPLLITFD